MRSRISACSAGLQAPLIACVLPADARRRHQQRKRIRVVRRPDEEPSAQHAAARHHADDRRRRDPAVDAERGQPLVLDLRLHTLRRRMLAVSAVMACRGSLAIPVRVVSSSGPELRPARFCRRYGGARSAPRCRSRTLTGRSRSPRRTMCGGWRRRWLLVRVGRGTPAVRSPGDAGRYSRRPAGAAAGRRIDRLGPIERIGARGVGRVRGELSAAWPRALPLRAIRSLPPAASTLDWGFALLLVPMAVAAATTLLMFGAGARRQEVGSRKSEVGSLKL